MKTLALEEVQGLAYRDAVDAHRASEYRLQRAAPALGARLSRAGGIRTESGQVGDKWKSRHSATRGSPRSVVRSLPVHGYLSQISILSQQSGDSQTLPVTSLCIGKIIRRFSLSLFEASASV
ncbi:hypothetical protein [Sinorhizobium sp. Sb3]|uniref:hypothetical protein n=1 Tax=Sinorhizobium sp. Sb3 TaxID=1358417 RepID=UPI0012E3BFC1|nr:hypothetical protein [Sinorhizobium sp. Sb3]